MSEGKQLGSLKIIVADMRKSRVPAAPKSVQVREMSRWTGIDEFVAVAQSGGFARAAERLGHSTSQVSRSVALLEDRLGLRLFYRTTRHVSLTNAGQRLLERCRKLIEDRDDAISWVTTEESHLSGHLRMTCSVAYGERFIAPLVNTFLLEHPKLGVDLQLTDKVLDLVAEGFDLAIRFGELKNSGLIATRLASRTRILCAAPNYLAQAGIPYELEDLQSHSCLRGETEFWIFNRDGEPYAFKPQGRWRSNSGTAALDAALKGFGLCRLPAFYVQEHIAAGRLVSLLDDFRPPDESVWALYPHRTHVPHTVRLMLDYLQQHYRAMAGSGL
jgi:DNA-binding transcriptional LysR family regulator